jgi:signal transduction histidine kinase
MSGQVSKGDADSGGLRGAARTEPEAADLVFAMCHEISNAVAAIRLQAHLIDDELDAKGLALATVELDDLAARASALLALVRPVLAEVNGASLPMQGGAILAALSQTLDEHGGRGARLRIESASDLPEVHADPEVMHYLLVAQVFCALEALPSGGSLRVSTAQEGAELLFVVEDDGPAEAEPSDWRGQSLRGRSLVCAITDQVLRKQGGRFSFERRGELTRAEFRLPLRDGVGS